MSTAAVLVTHNASAWIAETLASVLDQETAVDAIVIVDDRSTDGTRDIIRAIASHAPIQLLTSTSTAVDVHTRIAGNFVHGVQASGAEVVFLGDHDDLWHRDRVTSQLQAMRNAPWVALLASDGRLVEDEVASGRTLRDVFPVPAAFDDWPASQRFAYVVRHSVATGGACAIRPAAFHALTVPSGWLHDRWWSLWATAHNVLAVDSSVVIDYRVSPSQQVGLDTAAQSSGTAAWARHHLRHAVRSGRRAIDLMPLFVASR